jgi:FMN phosphatase YigB (HAD superfamily)
MDWCKMPEDIPIFMYYYVDIDCTLNLFNEDFCKRFGHDNQHRYNLYERYPDEKEEIKKYIFDPETYANLEPNPLSLKLFRYLKTRKDCFVYLATSRPASCYDATVKWLWKHEIEPEDLLFSTTDKISLIKNHLGIRPDFKILLDDNPTFLQQAKELGMTAIAWSQPWNKDWKPAYAGVHNKIYVSLSNKDCRILLDENGKYYGRGEN